MRCSLPAEERTIPLSTIAAATKLEADGVEFLLMKALSLHLIEGSIDQVADTVQVRFRPLRPCSGPSDLLYSWITVLYHCHTAVATCFCSFFLRNSKGVKGRPKLHPSGLICLWRKC